MDPGIPLVRAQNDALRPSSAFVLGLGAGAFRFEPVARLYFARPFAVSPAPCDTGSFSPRETERLTCFLAIGLFRRRGEAAIRLFNPTDVALDTVDVHKRRSGWRRVRACAIPDDDVQNDLASVVNDCVSHCLEVGCYDNDALRSVPAFPRES